MQEFNEQGTRKLKDTVEKELGNILDRLESLTSDQCSYDTFSGKAKDMEGNVKFVIETDCRMPLTAAAARLHLTSS